jgi:hypothetical protein
MYFESPYSYSGLGYELTIADRKVLATLAVPQNPVDSTLRDRLQDEVRTIFDSKQVITHQPYKLEGPFVSQYGADGTKVASGLTRVSKEFATSWRVDVIERDATGQIVRDTKAERIAEHKKFMDLLMRKFEHPLLKLLISSYSAAVNDSANEVVHLYEIRDALAKYFGSETEARKRLNVTKGQWQRLGFLANEAPLEQGRHRGRNQAGRREATQQELDEARSIARNLIEAFAHLI